MTHRITKFQADSKAQTSLYDSLLFFIIIIIAAAILYFASMRPASNPEYIRTGENILMAEDAIDSILISTINETGYNAVDEGKSYRIYDASGEEAIRYYLKFRATGKNYDLTELKNSIVNLTKLVSLEQYNFAFSAVYDRNPAIFIFTSDKIMSVDKIPEDRVTSVRTTIVDDGEATITYYIWNK